MTSVSDGAPRPENPRGPIMAVRNLRVLFPTRDGRDTVKAVDGVDFDVRAGETLGIIGEIRLRQDHARARAGFAHRTD